MLQYSKTYLQYQLRMIFQGFNDLKQDYCLVVLQHGTEGASFWVLPICSDSEKTTDSPNCRLSDPSSNTFLHLESKISIIRWLPVIAEKSLLLKNFQFAMQTQFQKERSYPHGLLSPPLRCLRESQVLQELCDKVLENRMKYRGFWGRKPIYLKTGQCEEYKNTYVQKFRFYGQGLP